MWNKFMKMLSYWYLQYELVTCLSVFEPWEKKFINGTIIMMLALVSYSTYVYLPSYTMSLLGSIGVVSQTADSQLVVDYVGCTTSRI